MNLSPPLTQKAEYRPISFVLDDQALGTGPRSVSLVIRPEDLTRNDPSRISVMQTLGGAWADSFGAGVPTITISGHTGWRRRESDMADGEERFQELFDQVFTSWHEQRDFAVLAGMDPGRVQLILADALDNFAVVVAPMSFTLRRSKSRPLLCQYQISLTVLQQNVDTEFGFGGELGYLTRKEASFADAGVLEGLGLDSLTDAVNEITDFIAGIKGFIDSNLVAPVRAFMLQTARLYGSVRNAITTASGIAGSLINIAQLTALAGVNLFRTLAAVASIPGQVKAQLMQVAGAYSNIFCVLKNALRQQIYYQDYSTLYGSSNCSSTAGGRPISSIGGQNPFYQVVPTRNSLPVSVTNAAASGLRTIAGSDTVLAPLSQTALSNAVRDIAGGLAVA